MRKKIDNKLYVGLDIGTSLITVVVLELLPENKLEVLGIGTAASKGVRKGVIVSIDLLSDAVKQALSAAELTSGCEIHSVYTSISGSHIKTFSNNGSIELLDGEVSAKDLDSVLLSAKSVEMPSDQKILHTIVEEYIIDNQCGIQDPIGMSGIKLEVKTHIISCAISIAQNIINTIRRHSIGVDDIILASVASSVCVLTQDEKQLGVCLLDIGAGTTDIAIYKNGVLIYGGAIPIAGDSVTHDIAVALKTSIAEAEQLKLNYGYALESLINLQDKIHYLPLGASNKRQIKQVELIEIMKPRLEEIFNLVHLELKRLGLTGNLIAGYVLTGGSCKTPGILTVASQKLQGSTRIGRTQEIIGASELINNPMNATAFGLALWGAKSKLNPSFVSNAPKDNKQNTMLRRIVHWFQGNF